MVHGVNEISDCDFVAFGMVWGSWGKMSCKEYYNTYSLKYIQQHLYVADYAVLLRNAKRSVES